MLSQLKENTDKQMKLGKQCMNKVKFYQQRNVNYRKEPNEF